MLLSYLCSLLVSHAIVGTIVAFVGIFKKRGDLEYFGINIVLFAFVYIFICLALGLG